VCGCGAAPFDAAAGKCAQGPDTKLNCPVGMVRRFGGSCVPYATGCGEHAQAVAGTTNRFPTYTCVCVTALEGETAYVPTPAGGCQHATTTLTASGCAANTYYD